MANRWNYRVLSRVTMSFIGVSLFFLTGLASALPAEIQMVTKVSLGKNPKLVIHVIDPVEKAVISLKRNDGKTFTYSFGALGAGAQKEVTLDGRSGRYHYEGKMTAVVEGEETTSSLSFETVVSPPLAIQVNRQDLDLDARTLKIITSREVALVTLKVIGLSGDAIEETSLEVEDWAPHRPIQLKWKHASPSDLVRLEVRVEDRDGFFHAVSLTPWSVEIPHEEVHFASGSAQVDDSEIAKLEDSLAKISESLEKYSQIQGIQLFIAGHTDTKGEASYNMGLSRNRARAIAAWFVSRKVPIKVSYEGFGESSPKVKTPDEVDEPQNRRVDYILSVEAPVLRSGSWKRLN